MRTIVIIGAILVLLAPATASAQLVGLYADPSGSTPVIDDVPGLVNIYAVVNNTPGATATQFWAPLPDCFAGATWLSDSPVFPVTIGNSQNGVAIGFGSCLASPIHVLTIVVFAQGLTATCCTYPVLPDPNLPSGEIEFVDCSSQIQFGTGSFATIGSQTAGAITIETPSPPNGSEAQAIDANLGWDTFFCPTPNLHSEWCDVYFGTTPDPPLVYPMGDCGTYDPGILEPNMTYYWKIRAVHSDWGALVSPVWFFTTESPVAGEQVTWGAIKAMMRSQTEVP